MQIDMTMSAADLADAANGVFEVAAGKVRSIYETRDPSSGAPVYTVAGRYTQRGWTEWTEGFQYGCAPAGVRRGRRRGAAGARPAADLGSHWRRI